MPYSEGCIVCLALPGLSCLGLIWSAIVYMNKQLTIALYPVFPQFDPGLVQSVGPSCLSLLSHHDQQLTKVIWGRGHSLKFHPIDWRSRGTNCGDSLFTRGVVTAGPANFKCRFSNSTLNSSFASGIFCHLLR